MSIQAYQQAASRVETPRELEYRLFQQVTRALLDAEASDPIEIGKRADALDWNRQVWTVMGRLCADPANALPEATRANIISLSIWVEKHTRAVIRGEESFAPLIEVNRTIMQGLVATTHAAA